MLHYVPTLEEIGKFYEKPLTTQGAIETLATEVNELKSKIKELEKCDSDNWDRYQKLLNFLREKEIIKGFY
jgi:hypothetical protein